MELSETEFNGHKFFFRNGSSDTSVIQAMFCEKPEYTFPTNLNTKCIFDIGGNFGLLSVILSITFPEAKIYSFEPVKENYDILRKNIEHYPNVTAYNFGLGESSELRTIKTSDDETDHGGFSLYENGLVKNHREQTVLIRSINEVIDEIQCSPDMIKIDTEGAEYDVLTSLKLERLDQVKYIIGELHEVKDFETLNHLRQNNFSLAFEKNLHNKNFMFLALR